MKIEILNTHELIKLIYGNQSKPKIKGLESNIHYFKYSDLLDNESVTEFKSLWIIMKLFGQIIGICRLTKNDYNPTTNDYWIDYLSIHYEFKGKGLSHYLVDYLFKYIKENNINSIETSSYSSEGLIKLKHQFEKYSKKYNVNFINK